MIIRSALIVAFALASSPASATVCQSSGNIAWDYEYVASQAETYVVVLGQLVDVGSRQELSSDGTYQQQTRFDGAILSGSSFSQGWSAEVTVTGMCQQGGCGGHYPNREGLFFLERVGNAYQFVADVCGGLAHYEPSPADLEAVIECHSGTCR